LGSLFIDNSLVCFSLTGKTEAIVQSIANGLNDNNIALIDITKPLALTGFKNKRRLFNVKYFFIFAEFIN